ncbi:DUF1178 family protein [Fodinicurvata sp. EGI_FJ10296]|uniref:DUF1178 family protein n=1 Tax=Fodinicurvata sp. EGI_FJ10296 TaxID=3231908 RepID=UPI00345509BD
MIKFSLKCRQDHEFDGWFRDGATYETQAAAGVIECPSCGDRSIRKAPMAPSIARRMTQDRDSGPPSDLQSGHEVAASQTPDEGRRSTGHNTDSVPSSGEKSLREGESARSMVSGDRLREMLYAIKRHVESNCDYVGDRFADEARRIHHGQADKRGIYGEASADEAEELADEGIEISQIPWPTRSDS